MIQLLSAAQFTGWQLPAPGDKRIVAERASMSIQCCSLLQLLQGPMLLLLLLLLLPIPAPAATSLPVRLPLDVQTTAAI
jgi:hypothetical protein